MRSSSSAAAFLTRLPAAPLPEPYLVGVLRRYRRAARLRRRPRAESRIPAFAELFAGNRHARMARRNAAVCVGLFGASVRRVGRPARRRPRDRPRRSRTRRPAPRAAAQGRGPHALLAHGRRPRGAALVDPRIPVLGSDASPRHSDHARAVRHRLRPAGAPRDDRDRGRRHARGAELRALRPLRALLFERPRRRAAARSPIT